MLKKIDRCVNILKLKRINLRIKLIKELNCYLKSRRAILSLKTTHDLLIINIICSMYLFSWNGVHSILRTFSITFFFFNR